MADRLDAAALERWCALAAHELARLEEPINALNVFPVADADTGTNMASTMSGAARAVGLAVARGDSLPAAAAAMAGAALTGARGNSGLILSQWLGGIARAFGGRLSAGPADLADALERGSELGCAAVAEPVNGTILSVAAAAAASARQALPAGPAGKDAAGDHRAAAAGAGAAEPGPAAVAFAAAEGGADELARSPLRLRALARAGVVDAGGRGLVAVLASLVQAIDGRMPDLPQAAVVATGRAGGVAVREAGSERYRHEVCYLLHARRLNGAVSRQEQLTALRQRLQALGDCVVIAGADELWRVHVHVNDVSAAVAAAAAMGEPRRLSVSRLVPAGSFDSAGGVRLPGG